ncbi:MAG: hypothetical protein ACYDAO_08640 [Thermoplasmataceae archaeon]
MATKRFKNLDAFVSSFTGGVIIFAIAFQAFLLILNGSVKNNIESDLIILIGGFIPAISVIVLSFLSLFPGKNYRLLGGLIMILSSLSWIGTAGGLLIGFTMAIVGGMMTYLNKSTTIRSVNVSSVTKV